MTIRKVPTLDGSDLIFDKFMPARLGATQLSATFGLYAPAPTGVRATDTANLQALVTQAQTAGGTIFLQAGTYAADLVTAEVAAQPVIIGKGESRTFIDGTLLVVGKQGEFCGGFLSDLSFVGTHPVALEIRGAVSFRWDRIGIWGAFDVGLLFHNKDADDFTELCSGAAHFGSAVKRAVEYRVTAGYPSFHGSGLTEGSSINQAYGATGPCILIGPLAQPYNAPLSVHVWVREAQPFIVHNGDATSNFYGNLKVELLPPMPYAVLVDPASTALPYAGTLSALGEHVRLGQLVLADQLTTETTHTVARRGGAIPTANVGSVLVTGADGPEWVATKRTNLATNPGCENDTTSWGPYFSPTVSRSTAWKVNGSYSYQVTTTTTANQEGMTYLETRGDWVPGETVTVAWTITSSVDITGWCGGWIALTGSPGAVSVAGENVYLAANFPRRVVRTFVVPPANAGGTVPAVGIFFRPNAAAPAIGTVYRADAVTVERGVTQGSAFDGSSPSGRWLGAVNASASISYPTMPAGVLLDEAQGFYAPTLTNVTLGNGSVSASYSKIGSRIRGSINLIFGSTTAFTGLPAFGLPLAAPNGSGRGLVADGFMFSGTYFYKVWGFMSGASAIQPSFETVTAGAVTRGFTSATAPFTWVSGNELVINFEYEPA